jgi:hypothetical protein
MNSRPNPASDPASDAPDGIAVALYACISGPAGAPRDWARFRTLFAPEARLMPLVAGGRGTRPDVLDVEGFIASRSRLLAAVSFWEVEVDRRVFVWRDAAHVLSFYESRREADGPPFLTGANSIQLYRSEGRWRIVSMLWDNGPDAAARIAETPKS